MKRSIARRSSQTRLWFPALNLGLVRPFRSAVAAPPERCKTVANQTMPADRNSIGIVSAQCVRPPFRMDRRHRTGNHYFAATQLLSASWSRRIPGSVYVRGVLGYALARKEGRASSTPNERRPMAGANRKHIENWSWGLSLTEEDRSRPRSGAGRAALPTQAASRRPRPGTTQPP